MSKETEHIVIIGVIAFLVWSFLNQQATAQATQTAAAYSNSTAGIISSAGGVATSLISDFS